MMSLGDSIQVDGNVNTHHQYLARVGKKYIVVVPIDVIEDRTILPFKEATYLVSTDKPFTKKSYNYQEIDDLAVIRRLSECQ